MQVKPGFYLPQDLQSIPQSHTPTHLPVALDETATLERPTGTSSSLCLHNMAFQKLR